MISVFETVYAKSPTGQIKVPDFLDNVKSGKWQDQILKYRTTKEKEVKHGLPNVTISGLFSNPTDKDLKKHSGFICIDIDNLEDLNAVKDTLSGDEYVYSVFTSAGGNGLAAIFVIDGHKHYESFDAITKYLYENYGLICDPSCRNVSRKRFVSYDPYAYINFGTTKKWDKFLKAEKPISKVVYTQSDFDEILQRITTQMIDITGDYNQWLSICFGMVDKFGEFGRDSFHTISQYSNKYDAKKTDRQYDYCLKAKGSKRATIGTVYYYAKQAGISTTSPRTTKISKEAALYKKSGLNKEAAIDNAKKFNQEVDEEIYTQVFDNDVIVDLNEDIIDGIVNYLRANHELKFNEITRRIESAGKVMDKMISNTLFLEVKKLFTKCTFELFERIIFSHFTYRYNPLLTYFEAHEGNGVGHIDKLFTSIISDTGDQEYKVHFGKKWLVSLIAAAHGEHSPLMLVLSGIKQGTGKTEFFRRLLPQKLQSYYAENKLDTEKDGEIMMTQKWLIMDDELGGKNKKESARMKELSSKDTFTIREPYGRYNEDLKRLAVLCGTSNESDILQDPTGNRRFIILNVLDIDKNIYNSINKSDLLMEAYQLYKSGFKWQINGDEVEYLNKYATDFESVDPVDELIKKYYSPVHFYGSIEKWMTNTDIKSFIETDTRQILTSKRIGMILKKLGFEQEIKNGARKYRLFCGDGIYKV